MDINGLLAALGYEANALPPNRTSQGTEVVVRYLDMEFPIDCVQRDTIEGRTVIAILGVDEGESVDVVRQPPAPAEPTAVTSDMVKEFIKASDEVRLREAPTYHDAVEVGLRAALAVSGSGWAERETKSGRKVRILCYDRDMGCSPWVHGTIIGLVRDPSCEELMRWNADETSVDNSPDYDLIPIPPEDKSGE